MIKLYVVDYEGGPLLQVKLKTWWRFIWSNPKQMSIQNPGRPLAGYQIKCYAAAGIGSRMFGYDFIIGRMWRSWERERQRSLKLPDCREGEVFDSSIHNKFNRNSKPFHPFMAWR